VPHNTVVTVGERRRLLPETEGEGEVGAGTMRLRIVAPAEWVGWASEKVGGGSDGGGEMGGECGWVEVVAW
jgi:hypothetical protein